MVHKIFYQSNPLLCRYKFHVYATSNDRQNRQKIFFLFNPDLIDQKCQVIEAPMRNQPSGT